MLSFDIRSLESQAAHVDGTVAPDDPVWEAGDMRPGEPIQVEGRLSAAGDRTVLFQRQNRGAHRDALPSLSGGRQRRG